MSQLSKNTTDLDALIDKANALPDAGTGGAVETCTVTISAEDNSSPRLQFVSYATYEDGKITPKYAPQKALLDTPYTITVVKGMPVGIYMNGAFVTPLKSVPSDWEVSILDGTHGTFIPYSDGEIVFNYDD